MSSPAPSPQTQTIWGNINSVITTTADAIAKLTRDEQMYGGMTPSPGALAFSTTTMTPKLTTSQWTGIAVLGGILLVMAVLVFREIRK